MKRHINIYGWMWMCQMKKGMDDHRRNQMTWFFSLLNASNRMNVNSLGLIIIWKSMEVMTVLDEIMGQWTNVASQRRGWTLCNKSDHMKWISCCFNATPWDETSFNEMPYIERGLWMNAWKHIKWIHENEMTQRDGASPIGYYIL
jgi:hypothetical protein